MEARAAGAGASAWDGEALAAALGVPVVVHGTVGSTMTEAESDARVLAVHLAERQTAGQGRHGRRWESPAGNLYATIAWPGAGDPAPGLLGAIQVAWAEAVAAAGGPRTFCKWPNDGIVGGGKWAGLLARRAKGRLLVGLGANLERAPGELSPGSTPAVALADHWRPWPGRAVVSALLLGAALEVLRAGPAGAAGRIARWAPHDALAPGEPVRVETAGGERRGTYLGVAPDGRLRLRDGGAETLLAAGDVTRLRAE